VDRLEQRVVVADVRRREQAEAADEPGREVGEHVAREVRADDDAIGVAVSEAGKRLNETDKQYVEVEPGVTGCPACGEPFDAAFLAANTALVGLLLEIDIFNADSEEHAERIAKSEVGGALRDVPLEVIDVYETEADEDEEEAAR
jgi:hypothetical protein